MTVMYKIIYQLQADLDSSIDEAKEISELREALESAERNMMESRQEIKELRIENETKLKDLVMKVCNYIFFLYYTLIYYFYKTSMQLNYLQPKAK